MAEIPAELAAVAFPTLSEADLADIAECPELEVRRFRDGETIFQGGDADVPFFIVKSGGIEIVDETSGEPRTIVVHHPGQFTGEVGWLTGARALATAIARGDTEAWAFSQGNLRELLNVSPDMGDVILTALIARRQMLRDSGEFTGLRVIGSRYSKDTFRIRDFLSRNRLLFTYTDIEEDPAVASVLEHFGLTPADTPVVAFGCRMVLRNPDNAEIARAIGIKKPIEKIVYDLAVVGGGPSGLAAAVYAASEGLSTVVLERSATGGQAGTSMRIENYLGFPTGLTGAELADRAVVQANKFGAILSVPSPVVRLTFDNAYSVLELEGGETVTSKSLLIASGAEYRRLPVEDCDRFEGRGVYYAATPSEAPLCRGAEIVIVGGGNSAGQAAVFLSNYARKVLLVVPRRFPGAEHVDLSRPPDRDDSERRGRRPNRGRRDARQRPARRSRPSDPGRRRAPHGRDARALFLHRGRAPHRLAPARGRARRGPVRAHGPGARELAALEAQAAALPARDEPTGSLRGR